MKQIYILIIALLTVFATQAQIVNIPDVNFKNALLNHSPVIDTNGDGEIQFSEAETLEALTLNNQNITSLVGIEAFINIVELYCDNNQLTSLDLTVLNELQAVVLRNNLFTSINDIVFPNNPTYDYSFSLIINSNQLSDVTNLPSNLSSFSCTDNQITSLNIDFDSYPDLYELYCSDNPLTSLEFNGNPLNFEWLFCNNTSLTSVDLSSLPDLTEVTLNNNSQLEYINWKSGFSLFTNENYSFYFSNSPNLTYICADQHNIELFQGIVDTYGLTDCMVNTYCSFEPGGDFYIIQGATKIDMNTNGCDAGDSPFENLKFNITQGAQSGSFYSDESGSYSFPVGGGTHTITPVLENPYFTVTPASFTVDFPTDTSPYTQDFCFTPNGTFNDLEITILPLEAARPGFDTDYKLSYKNKGTTTLSGSVDLMFQDDVMDLVSATPVADSQSINNLSWNYTNLAPFETGEILFSMNLNTPTETPALNGDDVLVFATTINPTSGDETPEDNVFTLTQTVVNSYDPNDKTCLEGSTITPDLIGEYVHYMIRFENTGTANAINVVVKDIIDTDKFDITTLFLSDMSHDVDTRITGNKVEFIFENINLPFDDANNDGYIAFKIKTLDTLVAGDTFENDAEIYFDYNFPILTNVAQTTIESTLGTTDNELLNLEIYPNPVNDVLTIKGQDVIESITIYDVSGRLINQIALIGNQNQVEINTSNLTQGTYFVKVKTESGEGVEKLIKE